MVVGGGGGGRGAKPRRVGGCALGVGRCVFRGLGQDFAKMVHFRPSENLENNFRQHVVPLLIEYSRCPGLPASSLPVCPVYRCVFFGPPRHPGLPVVCRYTGVVHYFMLAEPLLLLHTPTHAAARQHAGCCGQQPTLAYTPCQLSDSTTTPEFSCCGPCGGRLHRICGDHDDDEEVNRICEPYAAAKKSTSSTNDHSNAAKRKEGEGILQQSAPKKRTGETRKRLPFKCHEEALYLPHHGR